LTTWTASIVRNFSAVVLALGLAASLVPAPSRAAEESTDPSSTIRLVRNVATGPTNQVATAMFAGGVRNCAPRVDQVANFLSKGTVASALVFLPEREQDNSMVTVSMEVQTENLPRIYASATFSPNTAIGCAAEYESVQYWPESCSAVAAKTFRGAVPSGTLGTEINILQIGPSARVFMMRTTPTSCVTIKKELLK
jgi:hypothetical protein